MLCKAVSAEFGRSIAIGAATQHAFAKGNGFLYQRPMREWTSSLFCETSLSRVEEVSPMSVKSFIAWAGRRFMSALAHQTVYNEQYQALSEGERSRWNWRVIRRNPKVYVRGRVRHPDHKTVMLDGWHEVLSNTENLSHAMRNVAFLD